MNRIEFTRALSRSVTALFIGAVLAACGEGGDHAPRHAYHLTSAKKDDA